MLPHPTSKPGFARHVEARLARLRSELPALLPAAGAALVLEIGCGHGHFLTGYAAADPSRFFLGIDLLAKRLAKAERKREKTGLSNVRFARVEAGECLECLPAGVRFSEVYLLFPDPWPKKRHHKNRLVNPVFMAALTSRMAPGGRLFFRTDHADYFDAAKAVLESHPDWQLGPDEPWPFEETTVFQQRAPSYRSLIALVDPALSH